MKRLENAVLTPPVSVISKGANRKLLECLVVGGLICKGR